MKTIFKRRRNAVDRYGYDGKQISLQPTSGTSSTKETSSEDEGNAKANRVTGGRITKPRKKKSLVSTARSHPMRTRSLAGTFRLFDLPGETRNRIYTFAFLQDDTIDLKAFKPPAGLYSSHQLLLEATPTLFSTNEFKASVKCNWCVWAEHFHGPNHMRYRETGLVRLSQTFGKLVSGSGNRTRLRRNAVRFGKVTLSITCCCCLSSNSLGNLVLEVKDRHPTAVCTATAKQSSLRAAFEIYSEDVDDLLERISKRKAFNGFTINDINDFAACFRFDE